MNQSSLVRRLETEQSNSNDFKITVLSPSDNLESSESYKSYEKRLVAALRHELVSNIALTGIYGSGKSSILNTFKKTYENRDEWDFLEVSLSTFKVEKTIESDSTEDENSGSSSLSVDKEIKTLTPDKIQLIERSILQQFFYAVPQSDIPLSRFKRITENSKENYRETLWIIILALWSYLYAFNLVEFVTGLIEFANWYEYFNLVILIACTLFLIDKIFSYGFGLKEIKFNLHNAEFNIKNEDDKSILNDHLDEILYFFETTGKNVVIIEDLDRFNDTEIFIRLRELNSIINKSCPHRVVFIYAIRDDIFEDNERSKFFDYIIPVIPIVNPTTAYDIVKKDYGNIIEDLNNRFLLNTCLFFSDMRLLKNILNEYEVYFDQLQILDIDKNKLFAIVVYKNYYPNEFAKLNSNDGEVYNIFYKLKLEIIESLISEKEERLTSLRSSRDEVLNERLSSIDELNSVYAYKILSKLDTMQWIRKDYELNVEIRVNSNIYSAKDISSTEVLTELSQHQNLNFEITSTSFSKSFRFSDIEEEVDSGSSYLMRLDNLKKKKDGYLEEISDQESNIKNEIQNINKKKTAELLKNTDIVIDKPLLSYFIKNGFIDETYESYISYFFEESITLNDANYSLLVNSFNEPDFELELKKCNELVETYLGFDKLSTHSALNFSMLDFLLTENSKKMYLEQYIKVVCDGSSISIEFIKSYFKREENLSVLIPKIINLKEIVIDDVGISGNTKEALFNFKNFIKYIPLNRYQELAYLTEEFRRELSLTKDYVEFVLECFDGDFDRFKAFTDAVHPILECADFSAEQIEELNWLGENGYLAINKHMIKQILVNNLEDSDTIVADLEVKPVTVMANSNIDYLTKNLWSDNILTYVRIFLKKENNLSLYCEDESVYIKALNLLGHPNIIIEKFMDSISTKIKNIKEVENYYTQRYLISSLKVQYSWSNVFKCFSKSYEDEGDQGAYREIDTALVEFLESGRSYLQMARYSESEITDIKDWAITKEEFDECLLLCNNLSDEAYKKLIGITDGDWNISNLEHLSQEKVQTLIRLGKLSLTPENWEQIKNHTSNKVMEDFLVNYHKIIIDDLDSIELRPEDIKALLSSDNVSNKYKQVLAESSAIDLIESNETIREKIVEIYKSERMSLLIYDQLLKYADSKELKKLLLNQIKYLDKQEVLRVLELLDEPYQKLANGQEVEFENTDENKALINELNLKQIVMKVLKPTKPKGNPVGKKVLSTRLQTRLLSSR